MNSLQQKRLAVGVLSSLAIFIHGGLIFVAYAASGLSDSRNVAKVSPIVLLPFIYYAICLVSSVLSFKRVVLLVAGILAHLAIIPFCFLVVRDRAVVFLIGPLILSACWLAMCLEQRKIDKI